MVEILINSRWKIGSDKKQWIVYEKQKNTWRPVMFFAKLENLTLELMELSLKQSLAQDISELRQELKLFKKWLHASHFSVHFKDYQKTVEMLSINNISTSNLTR